MGGLFGSSKTTTTQSKSGSQDPWAPTIPYLEGLLRSAATQGGIGITPDQAWAFEQLKTNAGAGNPWAAQIGDAATAALSSPDRTGQVADAYTRLQDQIGGIAAGNNLDVMNNPQLMALLTQVGDDISNRINAQFAGAGRDLSGANQGAVAKGVAGAQTPILVDQYNRERSNQMAAAEALYGAGAGSATTQAQLDASRAALQQAGIGLSNEALTAESYTPNMILELDQQIKQLPFMDIAPLAEILYGAAGLGGSYKESGTGTSRTSSSQLGLNLLSDERVKEGIEQVGSMADGTPIYRWRYKGEDTVHIGPMAQEVEERHPEAVDEVGPAGLKTVNMDVATRKAAQIVKARRGKKGDR